MEVSGICREREEEGKLRVPSPSLGVVSGARGLRASEQCVPPLPHLLVGPGGVNAGPASLLRQPHGAAQLFSTVIVPVNVDRTEGPTASRTRTLHACTPTLGLTDTFIVSACVQMSTHPQAGLEQAPGHAHVYLCK